MRRLEFPCGPSRGSGPDTDDTSALGYTSGTQGTSSDLGARVPILSMSSGLGFRFGEASAVQTRTLSSSSSSDSGSSRPDSLFKVKARPCQARRRRTHATHKGTRDRDSPDHIRELPLQCVILPNEFVALVFEYARLVLRHTYQCAQPQMCGDVNVGAGSPDEATLP